MAQEGHNKKGQRAKGKGMLLFFALCPLPFALAAYAQTPPQTFEACFNAYKGQDEHAPKLCQPFADNGNREAMRLIADMYYWGWGNLKPDPEQAVLWYKRAATKGEVQAKYNLGAMYEQGKGVTVDYSRAARWFLSAATDGHRDAQFNIGNMYAKGAGTRQNDGAATKWYLRAAEQGEPTAQYNMGLRYAKGLGITASLVDAYKWFVLAEKGGDPDAANKLAVLKSGMNAEDMAAAEKLAAVWRPKREWVGME